MKSLFKNQKTNLSNQRHTGDVFLSRTHFEKSINFFSTNNFSTMEKIYTNTNSLKETQTTRSTSTSTNSLSGSASFFKTLALTLALFVVGIGSSWGQTFSIVGNGTGSNGTTAYPAPFGQYYYGARHQFFVTAAQLTASGITANASMSSIGFNVVTDNGTTVHTGFSIKVYTTTSTNPISAGYVTTGLVASTAVLSYNPTTGWNQINFQTPFTWNGTSNLVVETCFNNTGYTNNARTQWTTSGLGTGTWSRYYRGDNSTVCSNTSGTPSTTTRPNMRFGWSPPAATACTGTPAPGNTISSSATVTPGGTVNLSLQNATSGTGVTYLPSPSNN